MITSFPCDGSGGGARGVAIQSDGKIVIVGFTPGGDMLLRYTSTGALDTNFNGTGSVLVGIHAYGVAVQSDGGIVVAGWNAAGDFAVKRYTSAGLPDLSFNGTGMVSTDLGGIDYGQSVAVQTDGRIVVAGYSVDNDFASDVGLVRYTSTGALDTSFNGTGKVLTDLGGNREEVHSVALQDDGKIVVAGKMRSPFPGPNDLAVVRYTSTGGLDSTFNGSGKAFVDFGNSANEVAYAVTLQSNGRILAAGTDFDDFALVRLRTDGTLDSDFNGTGKVVTDFGGGDETVRAVIVQGDGKILAAGFANYDFALARYTSTGALDTSFSFTGRVATDFAGEADGAQGMALQSDGKIVLAGYAGCKFGLARYQGDPVAPEINITGNGVTIVDGDSTPSPADLTDFGANNVQAPPSSRTFVVWNLGDGTLHLHAPAVLISGPDAADFSVSAYPPAAVAPGAFGSFTIGFDPRAVGTRSATITILSDDSNERLYDFAVQGTGYVLPGDLDPTFNPPSGKVTTDFGGFETVSSMVVQSDDHIVVAGAGSDGSVLARYTSTGALDPSFNGTGKVVTTLPSAGELALSMALQADGRIVVAGYLHNGSNYDFALARYTSSGALDTNFNGTGIVLTPIGSGHDAAYGVAVQNDGRIVAAGYSMGAANANFAVARYTSTGALDTNFNGTGFRTTHINGEDIGRAVAIQSDGKIVVAGYSDPPGGLIPPRFALARYTSAGALDGTVTTVIGVEDYAYALAIQCDGRIVVAGSAFTENGNDFALVRYTPALTLDTSFNGTGIVTTDFLGQTDDQAFSVAVQADGKIVVGGASNLDFGLSRYTSGGALDFNLRANIATTGSGPGTQTSVDTGASVAIQSDGKILLAGSSELSGHADFALVRYINDTPRQFFDNVAAAVGLAGADAAPDATPFGDDVANLLKYAFNMNLAGPDAHRLPPGGKSGIPIGQLVRVGAQTFWQFEFIRRKGSGLVYTPQKSTTLAPGSFVPMTGAITVQNLGAECERVIVTESVDFETTPQFFSRLQVTLP